MKKIKVLLVTTSYPVIAGSGVFVKNLVDAFDENFEITVLTPSHQLINESTLSKNIKIVRYAPKKFETIAHSPGGIPQAIKEGWTKRFWLMSLLINLLLQILLNGKKYDVIYANWAVSGFLCGITKVFHRKKVVTSLLGSDVNRAVFSLIDNLILKTAIFLNDVLVCVSLTAQNNLKNNYIKNCDKFIFVPTGVANNFIEIAREEKKPNIKTKLIFCTVSSLIKTKSINTIIEALIYVKDDFSLYIIGEGKEEEYLKNLAVKCGLDNKIIFMGYQNHSKISSIFQDVNIFLFASYSEGRANVLYEALAAGLPIIASDIDANKELIIDEQTGLLFKTGDSRDLANKINKLIQNPALSNQISKNAYQYIAENNVSWKSLQSSIKKYFNDSLLFKGLKVIREQAIAALVKDKNVLDVGSVGQSEEYCLWNILKQSAKTLVGVDLPSAKDVVVNEFNLTEKAYQHAQADHTKIIYGNMETLKLDEKFDVIVAGDVIEHVSNQGLFLDNLAEHLSADGQLIITTPNAKWPTVFLKPNVTHVLWHDIFTLKQLLARHSLQITQWFYYPGNKPRYAPWLLPLVYRQSIFLVATKL